MSLTDQQVVDLVPCPLCGAARGEWCPSGEFEAPMPHIARAVTAKAATTAPVNPEFAAFAAEFRDHVLDGLPEDEKNLWRDLRTS